MKRFLLIVCLIFLSFTVLLPLSAKVRLPRLVSDRMVLQRDVELKIWGWASPGEKVTVRFQGKHYNTETDATGSWQVLLPPQKAGGPFLLEVNERVIRDVLVGDVWLCSGQSNQETPIARLTEMFPEINVSNNHMIRHYKVPTQNSVGGLKEDIAGNAGWHSAVASDVLNWTSLAYFFAQEAYDRYKVPVGMLVSSLGGSAIESWVSQKNLKMFPELVFDKAALDSMRLAKQDKGAGKWQQKNMDDMDWATMEVPGYWRENGIHTRGTVWYRKTFSVPESMVGRHARLYMGTLVDSDSIFVNGTFVGFTSYTYPPRKYDIPAGVLTEGKNVITVRLTANSANGGFVKGKNYKIVGDDAEIELTGTWKYKIGINQNEVVKYADRLKNLNRAGSGLYSGMIYPISNYQVKGTIWYQGESNTGRPQIYASLLEALIKDWRELWNMPDMPFLLVQLPNFMEKNDSPSDSGWARIREAQLKTALNVPYTSLAVTYDVGEWNDIHPLNKKVVAQRLFLGARKLVYGEKITGSGPLYKEMKVEGDKIILTFTEIGRGLICKEGKTLRHFAIAGEDQKFVWADAVIRGNKVIVSSKIVKNPVAVRYAWSNNPEDANLCNKEGLLASPFRTDNW
ncbi:MULTISPECIES: sialate O-acetylesterase [Bacteroides]|uniref:sialate O-acetylesterase n=1 Tax=Bacteroides TaxID=816 RepID=UPI000E44BDC4|nr:MULTISPECIES: sialate O-acetylesterase [Bacteroides]MBS7572662.1 beta galactosidase jelly roll domain-containing protein [Bacteroides propionicigenes]RGM29344.1 sialate O-acetylesterase [Bacteroides sp. OM08-17BH]HBO05491.1 sialate O-acetylesterase [Bacteroides sp.]